MQTHASQMPSEARLSRGQGWKSGLEIILPPSWLTPVGLSPFDVAELNLKVQQEESLGACLGSSSEIFTFMSHLTTTKVGDNFMKELCVHFHSSWIPLRVCISH